MSVPIGRQYQGRKIIYKYDNTGKQVGMDVVPCQIADAGDCWLDIPEGPQPNARYFYDPDYNRSAMITKANGDIYYFVYDPTASIPSVVYEQGPAKRYLNIREPDGSLVSRETYNANGNLIASRTYHYDGLGSTVALTDENGQVTDKYNYDEWGNVLSHTDAAGGQQNLTLDNPYQYVGRYGYYTHYQEPGFDLLQLGVRYYDPTIGRFIQIDPIKDGMSWYAYVEDNPISRMDPSGLLWCEVKLGWKCLAFGLPGCMKCYLGKKPPGRGFNVPIPSLPSWPSIIWPKFPKVPMPIKQLKMADKVWTYCQDGAESADASAICTRAFLNWQSSGFEADTCDPVVQAMINEYGLDHVAAMDITNFQQKCIPLLGKKAMGDICHDWMKLYADTLKGGSKCTRL